MTVEVIQMSGRAIVTLNDIGKNIYRDLVSEMIMCSNILSWLRLQIVLSGPEKEL